MAIKRIVERLMVIYQIVDDSLKYLTDRIIGGDSYEEKKRIESRSGSHSLMLFRLGL